MGKPKYGLSLTTMKFVRIRQQPKKRVVWYYQHEGEDRKQEIIKDGRWWYYQSPLANGGGKTGCDTLAGAKGDLVYAKAKVWRELVDN